MFKEFFKNLKSKFSFKKNKKPLKLGLALGSGGARGMAHIGILKAFEEENISFDLVAGSSIGSIIGGMYSAGFSSASMVAYLKELNITEPQTLIKYKLMGLTTEKLLDRMMGGAHFEDLVNPFIAVASDIDSGEEVRINSGNVARAMCASSAIPPFFKPVLIDEKRLIDGAYTSCVPAKAVKDMGADVVISVNLSHEIEDNSEIKFTLDGIYKENNIKIVNRKDIPYKNSDFMLEPELSSFSSASLKSFNEIMEIGYETAKKHMPEIKKMLKAKGIIPKEKR